MMDMEETMEVNEQKRQEAVLEKDRLEETLNDSGAECDKRGSEQSKNLERILELEVKLSSAETEKGRGGVGSTQGSGDVVDSLMKVTCCPLI